MKEKTIIFDAYELGAIDILLVNEIYLYKKRFEENEFRDSYDRFTSKNYLETLEKAHAKINKKEVLDNAK